MIRLFSILVDRDLADIQIHTADGAQSFDDAPAMESGVADLEEGVVGGDSALDLEAAVATDDGTELVEVLLELPSLGTLGRQGRQSQHRRDGARAGIPPLDGGADRVLCTDLCAFMASPDMDHVLPGLPLAVLHHALGGGGVASLRNDPQAMGYAQILLDSQVKIPAQLLED